MNDNQVLILSVDDVIDGSKGVTVRGMRFDAEYNVVLRRTGDRPSDIEIDSQQIGPISVMVGNNLLLLDQNQLKNGQRSLYNDIITAFEVEALKKGANAPDYKWQVLEYAV